MPSVQAGDVRLHYEERGRGPSRLLFVHGYAACWRWWEPALDRLDTSRYHAYAPDLRGTGDSDKPPSGYNVEQYAEDVFQFCRALGLTDLVCVGHSMGGLIAIQMALTHRELLRGLVLVDPAPADPPELTPEQRQLVDVVASQLTSNRDVALGWFQLCFQRPPVQNRLEALLEAGMSVSAAHARDSMSSIFDTGLGPRLGEITTPALLIGGDKDALVPLETMLATQQRIPGCGLHVFHRVGHSPQFEVPEHFLRVLTDFVEETLPKSGSTG
jgi:pimeloyl-ACP methyl ester carboxylesterase